VKDAMMWSLSPEGQNIIENLAQRHGVSTEAVMVMLRALVEGNGTMAQFDHPEFGGMGQWTRGGMTMVGDMFNNALKAKVDGLCSELAGLLGREPFLTRRSSQAQSQHQGHGSRGPLGEVSLFVTSAGRPGGTDWPADLGTPAATGSQNDIRYAFFPSSRRLAIEIHGHVTVYDTEDHRITGVSQQQSGDASLTFVSQHGLVRVADLRVVSEHRSSEMSAEAPAPAPAAQDVQDVTEATSEPPASMPVHGEVPAEDIFLKLERLADLRKKGVLSEDEFAAKKAELLSRL
jgi:hypothetical protein